MKVTKTKSGTDHVFRIPEKRKRGLSLIAAALAVAGCASTPTANSDLEGARSTYRMAATDPQVQLRAPVELSLAERSLAEAENLWRNGASGDAVAHQAYLAEQRSRIALRTAEYRNAEASLATAGENRNRGLLEARSREADIAKEHARMAEAARAEAERRAADLALQNEREKVKSSDINMELNRLQAQVSDLKAQQTERGWVLTMRNDMLFDSGSATLKPGARRAVDKLAEFLRNDPQRDIAIEGFTDAVGAEETNRRLSESRAEAVKRALVERGVERSRIDARGYGPAFPIASNETPTGRQLNRRVEIVINPS